MKRILGALALSLAALAAQAQDVYMPYDRDTYHLIDRFQIKYGKQLPEMHTAVKPYGRADVAALAEISARNATSRVDAYNAAYLLNDNWNYTDQAQNESRKPFLTHFYRNVSDLYHVDTEDFVLRVNPVIHFEVGVDNESDGVRYVNTRGAQIEGSIDDRFGFYFFVGENQARYPEYVNRRIRRDGVVPHEGFWKDFKNDGADYITARGYMNYALSKHVEVQLGHDRHFIGDGYRSLLYSDYAPPAFFLKLNTKVWKLHYMNLFQELIPVFNRRDELYPKKYMAMHRLGVNITDNFNFGLYEQVIFARGKGRFELQYLNPVIFYRSVEHGLGSPDNVLLGGDFRWNLWNRLQLYGQVALDEFVIDEVRAGKGWWGNKFGGQIGAKYIDAFGVSNLDLQGEVNAIRPYTYQYADEFSNFQHYRQPLAHPMGANLVELVGIVRYQPIPRLHLTAKAIATQYGQDVVTATDTLNYGNNVLLSYLDRVSTYGNEIGQGVKTNQVHADLTATFQLRHNLFVDLKQIVRRVKAAGEAPDYNTSFTSFALRWNIPQRLHEF